MVNWKFVVLGVLFILSFLTFSFILINTYLVGNYRIDSYWIGNDSNGVKYCDNCLWIRFDEGCNKYQDYYFKNQHELDNRLEVGMPVQIYFSKQGTIKNVEPRPIYSYCSKIKYEVYNSTLNIFFFKVAQNRVFWESMYIILLEIIIIVIHPF